MNDLDLLVRKHKTLDYIIENTKTNTFLSDWNCKHPFYKKIFSKLRVTQNSIQEYDYIRADDNLTKQISFFHKKSESTIYSLSQILSSNGSTSIISALFIWLRSTKINQIYYIPPVYYTFHYFSRLYGITLRPVTKSHLFEKDYSLNLPDKQSILLLTDPIWYAGVSLQTSFYELLRDWQQSTQSTIIIDGSFQYFKWDGQKSENASILNKNKTFRLVCPTKAIATHGFRFSYLLLPEGFYDLFNYILDNMSGSSSAQDILLAEKCMTLLNSSTSNKKLIDYTRKYYPKLFEKNIISSSIEPDCGYFVFAKLTNKYKKLFHIMDGKYFEQNKYKDYARINLLSPALKNLFEAP